MKCFWILAFVFLHYDSAKPYKTNTKVQVNSALNKHHKRFRIARPRPGTTKLHALNPRTQIGRVRTLLSRSHAQNSRTQLARVARVRTLIARAKAAKLAAKKHSLLTKTQTTLAKSHVAPVRKCKIPLSHPLASKLKNKLCIGGKEKIGDKRNGLLYPSQFDEAMEFNSANAARRSGLFRNRESSTLPYPPLLSANAYRPRDEDDGDEGMDEDEREEERRQRFLSNLQTQQQPVVPPIMGHNNFQPFPFAVPPRDAMTGQYERGQPNYPPSPNFPRPGNAFNALPQETPETLMPNGNFPVGEQVDNALERYMYGLTVARTPHRSSLNIPGDFTQINQESQSPPNSPFVFPPYNNGMHDGTVVPNMPPSMPAGVMDMAMAPQGEMQVAPRPLGAPFFMSQRNNIMGNNNNMFPREDTLPAPAANPALSFDKTPPQFQPSFERPMVKEPSRVAPAPDVSAINNIFNDIASDEKQYKENVGNNLNAQRKDVVQRRQFPVTFSRPQQQYGSLYDQRIETGSPEQNELERKYEMVLNSIAENDNYLREKKNRDRFERGYMTPIGSASMGRGRAEGAMYPEHGNPYQNYRRTNFNMSPLTRFEMMDEK